MSQYDRSILLANKIERAKQIIILNCPQRIKISKIARAVLMSVSEFQRKFKMFTGISPYQFYLKIQMEKAKILIGDTDLSLTDVAIASGFPDLSTFSRRFKKVYKQPPSLYRKTLVENHKALVMVQ